jgi:hypothetical protein
MNFFDHKDLGNNLLQLCPKVVIHPVYQGGYAVYNEILLQGGIQAYQKMGILVHSCKRATDSTRDISASNATKHRL